MKKVRLILGMLALVLGIGAATASVRVPNSVAFQWTGSQCLQITIQCSTTPGTPCKVTGASPHLREVNNTASSCGSLMYLIN